MPKTKINDFVVKFANINGSGSASANRLFARSVLRMGVPVSARNIFPSNIQGLPTWYEVRISDKNYLGARGGTDIMVAMNAQTWDRDQLEVESGGYLVFDYSRGLPASRFRTDITNVGIPITDICNKEFSDPRQRQLFRNLVYVGGLCAMLNIEVGEVERLVQEQFSGKDALISPNIQALHLGLDFVSSNYECPIALQLRRSDVVGDRIFIDGNAAAALGCIYGGATLAAWYPITPSSSVAENFEKYGSVYRHDHDTGKNKYVSIQAEDELASIGMVIGASWNGARAFTCTSGPGVSLMQEFIGLAYFAEIPAVIFDIQRGGPSTGMPTRTQQSDLLACAYASHGDTKHLLLIPSDPKECFEFGYQAFDFAERFQTPVFLMSDLEIGMNDHLVDPFEWDDGYQYDRGKILNADQLDDIETFGRYLDADDDGITYRTLPGTHPNKGAFFTRGTSKDRYAVYSESGVDYEDNMRRLLKKFETARSALPNAELREAEKRTTLGVVFYGSTASAMYEALDYLQAEDRYIDALRIRSFPFGDEVLDFMNEHEHIFVVEQNRDAQMRQLILIEGGSIKPEKLTSILHYDGTPVTARKIENAISESITALGLTDEKKIAF